MDADTSSENVEARKAKGILEITNSKTTIGAVMEEKSVKWYALGDTIYLENMGSHSPAKCESNETAAHIAHCVNSHAELKRKVEAAEKLVAAVEKISAGKVKAKDWC